VRLALDSKTSGGSRSWVEDVTCLACGCLCDDIRLKVSNGRITAAEHACERGRDWFLAERPAQPIEAMLEGRPATWDEAVARVAERLKASKAPLVTTLVHATCEDQAEAVRLAERLGAVIDVEGSERLAPVVAALQRVGSVWGSFGEIKQRADVVMFWNLNHEIDLPRFWERWVEPPGRFAPQGRSGRHLLALETAETGESVRVDKRLWIPSDGQSEALGVLRALVRGVPVDADRVAQLTGQPLSAWAAWADRLRRARYSVIVFGGRLAARGTGAVEQLLRLVTDLNASSRCVAALDLGPGNPAGAMATLAARLGAPISLDASMSPFRHFMLETSVQRRRARTEADALILVGGANDSRNGGPRDASIPTIWIGPEATSRNGDCEPFVAIATGRPGIDAGGTVERADEVRLRLKPPCPGERPSAAAVLRAIRERLP